MEHYRTLVAVQVEEKPALLGVRYVALERPELARDVSAGAFDLDDIRAEIGQQPRSIRPGNVLREVQDSHVIECLHSPLRQSCFGSPRISGDSSRGEKRDHPGIFRTARVESRFE